MVPLLRQIDPIHDIVGDLRRVVGEDSAESIDRRLDLCCRWSGLVLPIWMDESRPECICLVDQLPSSSQSRVGCARARGHHRPVRRPLLLTSGVQAQLGPLASAVHGNPRIASRRPAHRQAEVAAITAVPRAVRRRSPYNSDELGMVGVPRFTP